MGFARKSCEPPDNHDCPLKCFISKLKRIIALFKPLYAPPPRPQRPSFKDVSLNDFDSLTAALNCSSVYDLAIISPNLYYLFVSIMALPLFLNSQMPMSGFEPLLPWIIHVPPAVGLH